VPPISNVAPTQCACAHDISNRRIGLLSYWHNAIRSGIRPTIIFILDKKPKYRTVRLNTEHLATLLKIVHLWKNSCGRPWNLLFNQWNRPNMDWEFKSKNRRHLAKKSAKTFTGKSNLAKWSGWVCLLPVKSLVRPIVNGCWSSVMLIISSSLMDRRWIVLYPN